MDPMCVTAAVLKVETLWSNAVHPENRYDMFFTAAVSKFETLWLNAVQP